MGLASLGESDDARIPDGSLSLSLTRIYAPEAAAMEELVEELQVDH